MTLHLFCVIRHSDIAHRFLKLQGGGKGTAGVGISWGGGGGASDIRYNTSLSSRLIVAGGGGGSYSKFKPYPGLNGNGGGGGYPDIQAGQAGCGINCANGGTLTAGGVGAGCACAGWQAGGGTFGIGGIGVNAYDCRGAGGGGGYYGALSFYRKCMASESYIVLFFFLFPGGAGGCDTPGSAATSGGDGTGGGGSSFANATVTANTYYSVATTAGDGSVVIEVNIAPTATTSTLVQSRTMYTCTNGMQTFTAPAGVTSVSAILAGGSGGLGGGFGGVVKTTMRVTPGATYYVVVGCRGQTNRGGYNVSNCSLVCRRYF